MGLHHACGIVSVGLAWRHQILAAGGAQLRNASRKAGPAAGYVDVIERGIDSPHLPNAFVLYDAALGSMASALSERPWLAGEAYTLADAALMPYVLRLHHLALDWMWAGDRLVIEDWFERSRARANYRGIADYIEPSYVELATREGQKATPRLKEILND